MQVQNKDEELMTDYQFKCYKEERDEKDVMLRQEIASLQEKCAALEKENASLRASQGGNSENGMTDYQFKAFMALLRETMENAFEYVATVSCFQIAAFSVIIHT